MWGKGLKHEGKGNLGERLRREFRKFTTVKWYLFWAPGRVCSPADTGPEKMENTRNQAILLEGRGFYPLLVHTAGWQSLVQTMKEKPSPQLLKLSLLNKTGLFIRGSILILQLQLNAAILEESFRIY